MTLQKIVLLGIAAILVAGCSKDDEGTTSIGPRAFVRYINAVNDTLPLDARFVDEPVENLPTFLGVACRGGSGVYQGVTAGERQFRVFPNDTTPAGASQRLIDTTLNLQANAYYTLLHVGSTRAGALNPDRLIVMIDDPQVPVTAGTISVRAINASLDSGTVDIFIARSSVANPVTGPATPRITLQPGTASGYVTLPALTAGTADSLFRFAVARGGAATTFASTLVNQPGIAATGSVSAQPGVRVAGSVLTAVIFPASAPGSKCTAGAPATGLFIDRGP